MNISYDAMFILAVLLLYIFFNFLAILMNDRVNGSKGLLVKKVLQESIFLFILNVGIVAIKHIAIVSIENVETVNKIKDIITYIYMIEIACLVGIQSLIILSNRNPLVKSMVKGIAYIFTVVFQKVDVTKLFRNGK